MNAPSQSSLSIGQRFALILLLFYRGLLSPMFGGSCRFVPSCSEYAREAVIQHGAVKGSWLALRRVLRCHPAGGYGLDPVPK
jgi:putative membrane protein insertion efficiency factor